MFHINQIETTFGKVFDFGFDKWWFQLGKSRNTKKTALSFCWYMIWPSMMFPYCQSNPQGVDFLVHLFGIIHMKVYIFHARCLWWGDFSWIFMTCCRRPGGGGTRGGLVQREDRLVEVMAGCWPCRQVAVVPILSPRYHGSFCMKSFADIRIGYRYEFFRYHCMLICWFSQPKVLQDDFSNK